MHRGLKWFIGVGIVCILVGVAALLFWQREDQTSPHQSLLEYDMEGITAEQAVISLYENEGCADCHGFTSAGFFGLNRRGQVLAEGFEGCAAMLDRLKETLMAPEAEWTEQHRTVRSEFELFGCTTCHQIHDTTLEMTKIGAQAGGILHGFCVDMCCPPETMASPQPGQ